MLSLYIYSLYIYSEIFVPLYIGGVVGDEIPLKLALCTDEGALQ